MGYNVTYISTGIVRIVFASGFIFLRHIPEPSYRTLNEERGQEGKIENDQQQAGDPNENNDSNTFQ